MADKVPQTYENHAKFVPMYHFVTGALLLVNLVYVIIQLFRDFSWGWFVALLLAIALVLLYVFARVFATGVQDRVIRLEERIRFERLLPDDLQSRMDDFTRAQWISLRFASDEELPDLARKVLDEGIDDRKAIKQMITNWRPDYFRI